MLIRTENGHALLPLMVSLSMGPQVHLLDGHQLLEPLIPVDASPVEFGHTAEGNTAQNLVLTELGECVHGDEGFQKLVAVKKMHAHFSVDPEVVEAFIEEAKLAAFLQHPNIVQIYDFGCMQDAYFIVMEYLQGKDLRTLTTALDEQQRPLGLENSLGIAASICSGLEYAHRLTDMTGQPLHIVHRDISPQNIFVTYAGQVKILDFGIAKATDREGTTEAGVLKGKVAYMSPEQAQGREIDHRSDIFAVGIILYELLTGKRLYHGNTMEILRRAQAGNFTPPEEYLPDMPPELAYVFQRLLAVQPEDRFQDCTEALAGLEECLGDISARSIDRHLAELISDLFTNEKMNEEAALKGMMADDDPSSLSNLTEDQQDSAEGEAKIGGDRSYFSMLAALIRPRWRWLSVGIFGTVVMLALLMWIRGHIPGQGSTPSLEAFQARTLTGSASSTGDDGLTKPDRSDMNTAVDLTPLEQEARALMISDPLQARDTWQQVVGQSPDNVRAHFNLGLLYLQLEDYPSAIVSFDRVLSINPDLADARFNLGFAYAKIGQYDDAKLNYEQVVDQAPPYVDEVLFNLAIVQDFQGDRQAAARSLHKAIRYNPHNVRAISYLARMEGRFSTPQ